MTDEQRDNLLLSMYEALNNLDAKFEKKIDNLDKKFEQRINNLEAKFEQKFDSLKAQFEQRFNDLEARFEQKIDNLDTKYKTHDTRLDRLEQKLEIYRQESLDRHQEVMQELERLRLSMVKLENNLTDQIRTLFDLNQINEDKLKDHDAKLEEIDKTLDWHHSRIFKLEATH